MPASHRRTCPHEKTAPAGSLAPAQGFTLMEVIIVVALLAAFAAMAVPLAGQVEERGRVRETERRLALVREAMLGPDGTVDSAGRRLLAGYAGHLGGLPPLRRAVWDNDLQQWQWPAWDDVLQWWGWPAPPLADPAARRQEAEAYWASGMGQPRHLWLPPEEDLLGRWRGPYLYEPRDEFPGNADHLRWTSGASLTHAQAEANREMEMRQTAGRLADAWGRSLLFFYVETDAGGGTVFRGEPARQTTAYVVSEGPDLHSAWPAYDTRLAANEDNLVLIITPQEWNDEARREETRRSLQAAREAAVGPSGPVDGRGRPVFGGFVGDHGIWPRLYVWAPTLGQWAAATPDVAGVVYGQARGLWAQDTNGDGTPDLPPPPAPAPELSVLLGFGWRGPYLPRPDGAGQGEALRDAWGVPLRFALTHADRADPPAEQTLTIASAGPDGRMDTPDDLRETIPRQFDVRAPLPPVTIEGTVVNETEQDRWYRVRLHASPGFQPTEPGILSVPQLVYGRTTVQGQVYGNTWSFRLAAARSSAGPRLLELVEEDAGGARIGGRDWATVHIGSGGTATPERGTLVLRAR